MIRPIKHDTLDCTTLADVLGRSGIQVTELEDLSDKVPHVGYGGAGKSKYTSPKSGSTIFVLERNGLYAPDAYLNDVWQFNKDFTTEEAKEFLVYQDNLKHQKMPKVS